MCIYVDDMLIIGKLNLVQELIRTLGAICTIKLNKEINKFVGWKISWQEESVTMTQQYIIDKLNQKYHNNIKNLPSK